MSINGLSRTLLFIERDQKRYFRDSDEHKLIDQQMREQTKLIIDLGYKVEEGRTK